MVRSSFRYMWLVQETRGIANTMKVYLLLHSTYAMPDSQVTLSPCACGLHSLVIITQAGMLWLVDIRICVA